MRLRSIVLTAALIASFSVAPLAAQADVAFDLNDPLTLVQSVAPDKLLPVGDEVALETPAEGRDSDVSEVTFSGSDESSTTVDLDDEFGAPVVDGEFQTFLSEDGNAAVYAKPNPAGGQIIFAAADEDALDHMDVTFDVADDATLVPSSAGFFLDLADGSTINILHPWARDASGADLVTSYELDGGTLTQHVATTSDTVFPVVADPAWTYTIDYSVGARNPGNAQYVLSECFNCYFPVEGAPASMPVPSQILPLKVRPYAGAPFYWNFECIFNSQTLTNFPGYSDWEMIFAATSNHVDGAGSSIDFLIFKKPGEANWTLRVSGYVVNNDPLGLGRPVYLTGAFFNWANFASNLTV